MGQAPEVALEVELVDAALQAVPVEVAGELLVQGLQGIVHAPALQAGAVGGDEAPGEGFGQVVLAQTFLPCSLLDGESVDLTGLAVLHGGEAVKALEPPLLSGEGLHDVSALRQQVRFK